MASVEQQFLEFWSNSSPRVAHWADSSYGPLEEKDILKLAKEVDIPIVSFTPAFGAGFTVKADFHDPAGKPEEVVIIEMGYNDESNLKPDDAHAKMRQRQWYKVLQKSAAVVKYVIFIHQPAYIQVCPPKKKNAFNQNWKEGTVSEGSTLTCEAMKLCQQELRIPCLCLKGRSAEEMFGEMLTTKDGVVWQNKACCRSPNTSTKKGPDLNANYEPALWEDFEHPTALGAQLHFRCVAAAFKDRCAGGGFLGGVEIVENHAVDPNPPKSAEKPPAASSAPQKQNYQGGWKSNQSWSGSQGGWNQTAPQGMPEQMNQSWSGSQGGWNQAAPQGMPEQMQQMFSMMMQQQAWTGNQGSWGASGNWDGAWVGSNGNAWQQYSCGNNGKGNDGNARSRPY